MSAAMARGPGRAALGVLALGLALILGAWGFELAGYAPCKLCLWQRWPYYAALPLAALAALFAGRFQGLARGLLGVVALVFLVGAGLAAWHAGIEWGWWPGPAECAPGRLGADAPVGEFLKSLETARVVRCDVPALRIAGLSLAGWNALGSLALAGLAAGGLMGIRKLNKVDRRCSRLKRNENFQNFVSKAKTYALEVKENDARFQEISKIRNFYWEEDLLNSKDEPRILEMHFGWMPFESVKSPKSDDNLLLGYNNKIISEQGASLIYQRGDNGFVLCTLHPARTENYSRKEDGVILAHLDATKLWKRKNILKGHLNYLIAYMQCTSLDGQPSFMDKIRVQYLMKAKNLVVNKIEQQSWLLSNVGSSVKFLFNIGLSGFLIFIIQYAFFNSNK